LERSQDILRGLTKRLPSDPWHQRDLAVTLRELAKLDDAAGNVAASIKNLSEAKTILARLVEQYPNEAAYAQQLEETMAVKLGDQRSGAEPIPERAAPR
jgi:hypothetical protein